MTREDFYDWLICHGCTFELPQNTINHTGNVVKVIGKTSGYAYFDMPIDGRQMRCTAIKIICERVYVPIPDVVQNELKELERSKPAS